MLAYRSATHLVCLLSFVLLAGGNDSSDVDRFLERSKNEFNSLIRLCSPARKDYWNQRADQAFQRYSAKSNELRATSEALGREPNGKELQGFFAFQYVRQVNELQLEDTTRLVEDLGRELLNDRVTTQLSPKIQTIETQFTELQGKPQTDSVRNSYLEFLQIKRMIIELEADAPVKEAFKFEPRINPYSYGPTTIYTIHDWHAALAQVDQLRQQLQPIQDRLEAARLFSPKDPIPWLPVITQISFLLVAMAGWIKTYHSEEALWTIVVLVASSMLLSVFLVFVSEGTLLNILAQSIIPGGFMLSWVARKKGWLPKRTRVAAK